MLLLPRMPPFDMNEKITFNSTAEEGGHKVLWVATVQLLVHMIPDNLWFAYCSLFHVISNVNDFPLGVTLVMQQLHSQGVGGGGGE